MENRCLEWIGIGQEMYVEQPIIGANGEKKTAEFSYKRKEDMNDLQKKRGTILWNVNDLKDM